MYDEIQWLKFSLQLFEKEFNIVKYCLSRLYRKRTLTDQHYQHSFKLFLSSGHHLALIHFYLRKGPPHEKHGAKDKFIEMQSTVSWLVFQSCLHKFGRFQIFKAWLAEFVICLLFKAVSYIFLSNLMIKTVL